MIDNVRLTLMTGTFDARPVQQAVLDALTSVQVTAAADGASGFQLTFSLGPNSALHDTFLRNGPVAGGFLRVIIVVAVNGQQQVLIDGVMTHHQAVPGQNSNPGTLTITGEDLSALMNHLEFSGFPFPAMPPEARIALLLAKYAPLGVRPRIIPSILIDVPNPVDRIEQQKGTDLAYIRQLAQEAGYVFYITPGPEAGKSEAYWGPEIKFGSPQPALNADLDGAANVDSLSFSFNPESAVTPLVTIQNESPRFSLTIPIPPISGLIQPLGALLPAPLKTERLNNTAKFSPVRALLAGLVKAAQGSDSVTGNGTLRVSRYGRVLRSRELVGVRGAGAAYDGVYYVKSVTHDIKRGEYTQSFSLARSGVFANSARVPA